ncbi:MEKHLA domain-containing protein [Burkholderia sp. Ac-20384]|uniref:MEKHLA domain-containing protein n=1 Tax=Burkholderia sp. Ac-20384 TaxID=2703902 RepID=UPI001980FA29|nr:MEKHLA domain-containing protein [Burkholderia sp. Ac-20384]MBN3828229.1 MEKHLA domain-containing protein [Burkholderia sp. Ac-20384]
MVASLRLDGHFYNLLSDNYYRFVGEPLVDSSIARVDAVRWLYEDAPFCVLVHNSDADPKFIYANRTAQHCFESDWDRMTSLPSRLSAEHPNRSERERLLESVRLYGFAKGYRGLRISSSGRRFWISDVTVWNLIDSNGVFHGQAATYYNWEDA